MKKVLLSLLIFASAFLFEINAQSVVDIPGADTYIFYNSGSNSYGSGTGLIKAGISGDTYRSYIHWSSIKNYIPIGAQIQSVQITIGFQPSGSTSPIEFHDFTDQGNITLKNPPS